MTLAESPGRLLRRVGTLHFVIPRSYEAMMPPSLPAPPRGGDRQRRRRDRRRRRRRRPATRRFARWWLLALLVAVFPANVHMAVNPEQVAGLDLDTDPALGALGAAAAAAAGDALGLARDPRLSARPINAAVLYEMFCL